MQHEKRKIFPVFSLLVLGVIILGCLFGKVLATGDPFYMNLTVSQSAARQCPLFRHGYHGEGYILHDMGGRKSIPVYRDTGDCYILCDCHCIRLCQRPCAGLAGRFADALHRDHFEYSLHPACDLSAGTFGGSYSYQYCCGDWTYKLDEHFQSGQK